MSEEEKKSNVWSKIKKILLIIGSALLSIFLLRRCGADGRGIRQALARNRQLGDELERERQANEREAGRVEAERGRLVRESVLVEREAGRVEAEGKRLEREGELSDSERKSVSAARDILEGAKKRGEQGKNN